MKETKGVDQKTIVEVRHISPDTSSGVDKWMLTFRDNSLFTHGEISETAFKAIKHLEKAIEDVKRLLMKIQPDACLEWKEGEGDCHKSECNFCEIKQFLEDHERD